METIKSSCMIDTGHLRDPGQERTALLRSLPLNHGPKIIRAANCAALFFALGLAGCTDASYDRCKFEHRLIETAQSYRECAQREKCFLPAREYASLRRIEREYPECFAHVE